MFFGIDGNGQSPQSVYLNQDILIYWDDRRFSPFQNLTYGLKFNDINTLLNSQNGISLSQNSYQSDASVLFTGNNLFMGFGQTDGDINQYYTLLDTDLNSIFTDTAVDENPQASQEYYTIVRHYQENLIYYVYSDNRDFANNIYVQQFDLLGNPTWSSPIKIVETLLDGFLPSDDNVIGAVSNLYGGITILFNSGNFLGTKINAISINSSGEVSDGWTEAFRLLFGSIRDRAPSKLRMFSWAVTSVVSPELYKLGFKQFLTNKAMTYMDVRNAMQMADYQKMEKVRARADEVVQDKDTAESLKPYYNQFCKRPCFHDEYLQTFNLPNVELIDTDGKGLSEISEKGIIYDGKEYEVDCIIFATGFEVGTDYSRRAGYQIYGVDGVSVSEKWQEGLSTFHGMHSKGFPNCFFFGPAQSGFTATFTYSLDEQSIHLAYILKTAKEKGTSRIEASQEAEEGWVQTIIEKARLTADFQEKCTPGYYNNEGKISQKPQNGMYGGGPIEFFALMKKWRSKGNLEGLELTKQ